MNRFPLGMVVLLLIFLTAACQQQAEEYTTKTATDANGYTYEYVPGDDSGTRIYTLDNGLKVYLSVYKDEPRIQTLIPVKAGGKFDPANSTGLAHYLEHMMFKGTTRFGTKNWEKEKVYVDSIENMFEHYRTLEDPAERKAYYAKIDQVSNEASELAIANEYDKMMAFLGAKGTNAYTTTDRTVYVNNIPSNQLENFLQIESERFSTIVNRLFHTELEAVYEEKNRGLDNDFRKVYERMLANMFQKHPYGTQTVIGTIEHLKNPSIKDINAYFDKYYVPNNMAVCLSGDLDPEKTIQLVDQYFGQLERSELEDYEPVEEPPLSATAHDTVYGPDAESVQVGFRFGGVNHPDQPKLMMVDYLLNNSTAGLIDLNLVQKQQILRGGSYPMTMNDYSIHVLYGNPREGQSLEEVRDKLLEQIELLKQGEFEDWLMEAIVNDFKKSRMRGLESNYSRTNDMVMAFTNGIEWADYLSQIDRMAAITKEELVAFVKEHYRDDNFVAIYKKTGEDPNKKEVEKPAITKVQLDRSTKSEFHQKIEEREVSSIQPVFVNYQEDIARSEMAPGIPILHKQNQENELFTLYYLFEFGTNEDPQIELALNYLEYLGTTDMPAEEVKKEFYKLGCNFSVFSSNDRIYVTLTGLSENMAPAMDLFEHLLANPQGDEEVLRNMISDTHKERADNKKSKSQILWSGLMNYVRYGKESPFTNVLSNGELDNLQSEELIAQIKSLPQTQHKVMYYGPMSLQELESVLKEHHRVPGELQPVPERREFAELAADDPQVFFTDYDMVQAEIVFNSPGPEFNPDIAPEARLFNEYFGGGMSSLVFQEIREAQGLAYSVFSRYLQGDKLEANDRMMAYVGTQADKQEEAMDALMNLINELPKSQASFETAKKSILEKIASERVTKTSVLFNYLNAQEKGLDYDLRRDIFERVEGMTFTDLRTFHEKYIKDKDYNVAIIGDKEKLDFVALGKYGEVQELSLEELFGYEEREQELLN